MGWSRDHGVFPLFLEKWLIWLRWRCSVIWNRRSHADWFLCHTTKINHHSPVVWLIRWLITSRCLRCSEISASGGWWFDWRWTFIFPSNRWVVFLSRHRGQLELRLCSISWTENILSWWEKFCFSSTKSVWRVSTVQSVLVIMSSCYQFWTILYSCAKLWKMSSVCQKKYWRWLKEFLLPSRISHTAPVLCSEVQTVNFLPHKPPKSNLTDSSLMHYIVWPGLAGHAFICWYFNLPLWKTFTFNQTFNKLLCSGVCQLCYISICVALG